MKFKVNDQVKKVGGSYQATGIIKAAFLTRDVQERYVFDFNEPKGMLHIFSGNQLEFDDEVYDFV